MTGGPWDAGRIREEIRAERERFDERGPYVTAHLPGADPRGLPVATAKLPLGEEASQANAHAHIRTALGQACAPVGTYTMVLRDSGGGAMVIEDVEHW